MKLEADETLLTGQWLMQDGHVVADETTRRIEDLVSDYLEKLGHDESGWDTLYQDPHDGRYWERIYPMSAMHGGGPPELRCLTLDQAKAKYVRVSFNQRGQKIG